MQNLDCRKLDSDWKVSDTIYSQLKQGKYIGRKPGTKEVRDPNPEQSILLMKCFRVYFLQISIINLKYKIYETNKHIFAVHLIWMRKVSISKKKYWFEELSS